MTTPTLERIIDTTDDARLTLTETGTEATSTSEINTRPFFAIPSIAGGKLRVDVSNGGDDYAESLVVQPDGKIIVAGTSEGQYGLIRLNTDGTLDTGFGTGGKLRVDVGSGADSATGVVLQADGKIVVAGFSGEGITDREFSLIRLNANGTLDTSFGAGGKLVVPVDIGSRYSAKSKDTASGLVLQADGKIVVTGSSFPLLEDGKLTLIRVNANGTLDSSFDADGKLVLPVTLPSSGQTGSGALDSLASATSAALQPDGKLVVTSTSGGDFSITRLNTNGTLDTSFGTGGTLRVDVSSGDYAESLVIQPDGKIIVAGGTTNDFGLIRLNADGSLDTGFGTGGKVIVPVGSQDDHPESVVLQADGKIVVAGRSSTGGVNDNYDFSLIRLNANGTLDTSFGVGGKVVVPIGYYNTSGYHNDNDAGYSVAIQADGKIVVAGRSGSLGSTGTDFALIRLNPDGSLDTSFNATVQPPSTLDAVATYTGNPAVVLDATVAIHDAELAAIDNYAGATLTLARQGGANPDDLFGGFITTTDSGRKLGDVPGVGSYTQSGGTLILTFDNSATQARINEILSKLTYQNLSTQPPASVQIVWTFSDGNTGAQGTGGALAATGITTVNIINTGPTISGVPLGNQAVTVGTPAVLPDFTVSDANGDTLTVQIKADKGSIGGIATGTTGGVKVTTVTGGFSLQGSGPAINTLLAGATFTAKSIGAATIEVSVNDGRVAKPVTASYELTASNTAPTITGLPSTAQAIKVGTPAALADFTVADTDGHALAVTLKPSNGSIGGLAVGTAGGVEVTSSTVVGWKLQGSAADINTLLAGLSFTASAGGAASIAVTVDDDYVTTPVNAAYAFTASHANANAPPAISGVPTTAQTIQVGAPAALADFTVTDADGDVLTVTLVSSNGCIDRVSASSKVTVSEIPGGYSLQGAAADINAGLKHALFSASAPGPASITVTVTDGSIVTPVSAVYAFTASGTSPSNTAPTLSGIPAGNQAVTVGTSAALANFTVADADGDALTVTLVASNGSIGGISAGTSSGATTAAIAGGWSLQGSAAAINTLLAGATFTADAAGAAAIAVTVSDGHIATPVSSIYAFNASASNTEFLTSLYRNLYIREPDAGGLAHWLARLEAGESRENVVDAFATSEEAQLYSKPAIGLYLAILGRVPDAGGYEHWTQKLRAGTSVEEVSLGFFESQEFQSISGGNITNERFVELLYERILGRNADVGGFTHWVDKLASGTVRTEVASGFLDSVEFNAKAGLNMQIVLTFLGENGRLPSQQEFEQTLVGNTPVSAYASGLESEDDALLAFADLPAGAPVDAPIDVLELALLPGSIAGEIDTPTLHGADAELPTLDGQEILLTGVDEQDVVFLLA